jgi:hypothetical protein
MNCANHPEVAAAAFCRECGKPMCVDCQRPALGSVYCAEHLPAAAVPPSSAPPPKAAAGPGFQSSPYASDLADGIRQQASSIPSPYTAPAPVYAPRQVLDPGAHPALALLLGFIPGVGAIYNGQYAKGLIHAVIFGLLVSLETNLNNGGFEALVGIMIGVWVIYQAFEAFHTARKRRYGIAVDEFSSLFDFRPVNGRFPVGAILLIGLGFFLLLDTTGMINFRTVVRYSPGLLIVFGLYLLYNRLGADSPRATSAVPPPDSPNGGARR